MGRIPREVVDAVRENTDIVEVVQRHVRLTRRGSNHVGLCPFHQEKTPSFNVVQSKQIYHCFGCNEGGDAFKFLMRIEGLSFVEAVRELAGPAGIEIETRELTPAERRDLKRKATLYDVLEAAAQFYEGQLWTGADGGKARDYLSGRGFTPEQSRSARLGWAPDEWTRLVDHLHREGFNHRLALEAGLAKEGRNVYDAMRGRIVFPIEDDRGRVIGFGGRILEGDGPKYLNSPETRLYQKSKVLYGMHAARNGIGRLDRVLVVEGYFDVLALHSAGFTEAVATCGTSLTPEHLERVRRLTRNVILLLDADEAGSRAAERTLPLCVDAEVQAWRLQIPDAKDPDELIQAGGAEAMEAALKQRVPLLEWVIRRRMAGAASGAGTIGAMNRDAIITELMPLLLRLPDTVISNVAALVGVHEAALRQKLASQQRGAHRSAPNASDAAPAWKPTKEIVHLLWLMCHRRDQVADLLTQLHPSLLAQHPPEVALVLAQLHRNEPPAGIMEHIESPGLKRTLAAVLVREHLYPEEAARMGACQILLQLARPILQSTLQQVNLGWAEAAQTGDMDQMQTLGEEKRQLLALQQQLQESTKAKDFARFAEGLASLPRPS